MLCNLLQIHLSTVIRSLHLLVENDFLSVEWESFRPFYKAHHDPPKLLTTDPLSPPRYCHRMNFAHTLISRFTQCGNKSENPLTQDQHLGPYIKDRFLIHLTLSIHWSWLPYHLHLAHSFDILYDCARLSELRRVLKSK